MTEKGKQQLLRKIELTEEQFNIIGWDKDAAINAVAGSGKTTTIIEFAASRPPDSKILYLAFNKSVKLEAIRKFAEKGLLNVKVETAHSLAFRHIMRGASYRVRAQGYKTHEVAEVLSLQGDGEKHTEYIIANHINKFVTYFCNSDKSKVQELKYADTVSDPKAKRFVQTFYRHIEDGTRMILAKMDKGEIEITHDFYLKKFQLSGISLPYDYILFDEGQDASAAMLDVFFKQKAVKIIVGDAHQQIYGWRFAVNSLTKTQFKTFDLSTSFRFPQDIADLACSILAWKKQLGDYKSVKILGRGKNEIIKTNATLARSNLGLLLNAINYITDHSKVAHIYFEGNINSYTYADDGTSLYDVLSLYNDNHDRIRDKLIQSMKTMFELEQYIKSTEDAQLGMMVEIVNEYGNEIPSILKRLKSLHTGDEERNKAEMIFSTVHRAKGMEYDSVRLVNDFISEEKIERAMTESKKENRSPDTSKLNEEINLLYVAVTRAKTKLFIPEGLLPINHPPSAHIEVIIDKKPAYIPPVSTSINSGYSSRNKRNQRPSGMEIKERSYSISQKRTVNRDASKPWTSELDKDIIKMMDAGKPLSDIADYVGRTKGGVITRLKKLNYFSE